MKSGLNQNVSKKNKPSQNSAILQHLKQTEMYKVLQFNGGTQYSHDCLQRC